MSTDTIIHFDDYAQSHKAINTASPYETYDGKAFVPLWDYSLDVYGRDGVDRACLALQDYFCLDVNMVLYCLWAGRQGYQLTENDINSLADVPHGWQVATVMPIRVSRLQINEQYQTASPEQKPNLETLYRDIKQQELDAERMEQDLIQTSHQKHILDGIIWVSPDKQDYGLHNVTVYSNLFANLAIANDDTDSTGENHGETAQLTVILQSLNSLCQPLNDGGDTP